MLSSNREAKYSQDVYPYLSSGKLSGNLAETESVCTKYIAHLRRLNIILNNSACNSA